MPKMPASLTHMPTWKTATTCSLMLAKRNTMNLKIIQSGTIKPAVARLVKNPVGYTPNYPKLKKTTLGNKDDPPRYPTSPREMPPPHTEPTPTTTNIGPTPTRPANQSPEPKPNPPTAPNPPYHTSATSSSPTRPTNHKQETNLTNPPARLANQSQEQKPNPPTAPSPP